MTRILQLLFTISALSACTQYREPQANCFGFVSPGPASLDCDFEALGGPELMGGLHE